MFGLKSKEKLINKLENKKVNTLNMIYYYEQEINNMESSNKRNSFSSKESYEKYLNSLKKNLLKQHEKLIDIIKYLEDLQKDK